MLAGSVSDLASDAVSDAVADPEMGPETGVGSDPSKKPGAGRDVTTVRVPGVVATKVAVSPGLSSGGPATASSPPHALTTAAKSAPSSRKNAVSRFARCAG